VFAEISIGLAGFTGIMAALYARDTWHPFDRFRTVSLLIISFGALAFALAPHGLHLLGVPDETLWRICSGAFVAFAFVTAIAVMRLQPPGYSSVPFYPLVLASYAALISVAVGLFPQASSALYFAALFLNLGIAGVLFLRVASSVLASPSE
jgi:hypothetical protein